MSGAEVEPTEEKAAFTTEGKEDKVVEVERARVVEVRAGERVVEEELAASLAWEHAVATSATDTVIAATE